MVTEVRADFPAEAASASQARRFVDTTLRGWDCDGLLEAAVLLSSELVSNAVLHAGTKVRVVLRLTPARVRVEVRDGSPQAPTRKHYSALSTTGRGLLLVEELADEWGVDHTEGGKAVWFELERAGAAETVEAATTAGARREAESRWADTGGLGLGTGPSGEAGRRGAELHGALELVGV